MWLADKVRELEQRIEKLEVQDAINTLDNITKQARKIFDEMFEMVREMPKPHYTRGQEVEVYTGKHVNHWQKALYLERLKEDVHLVFIEDGCKLGQFSDHHIQPLLKSEKPTFTRGQKIKIAINRMELIDAIYIEPHSDDWHWVCFVCNGKPRLDIFKTKSMQTTEERK